MITQSGWLFLYTLFVFFFFTVGNMKRFPFSSDGLSEEFTSHVTFYLNNDQCKPMGWFNWLQWPKVPISVSLSLLLRRTGNIPSSPSVQSKQARKQPANAHDQSPRQSVNPFTLAIQVQWTLLASLYTGTQESLALRGKKVSTRSSSGHIMQSYLVARRPKPNERMAKRGTLGDER